MVHPAPVEEGYAALTRRATDLRTRGAWDDLIALAADVPKPLTVEALELADVVCFALGHVGEFVRAFDLAEALYAVEPSDRRASGAAWVAYASLMEQRKVRQPDDRRFLERQRARDAFRRWNGEALARQPGSIKDLYRLGLFEAQLEAAHDKPALRAFLAAVRAFEALPEATRARRGDLRKAYHRALYAGARSALRLGELPLARKLSFVVIRSDGPHDDVDPVFKLGLAGKICLALEELDHAERAFRLALDAKGPPRRDFLFMFLARVCLARGDAEGGCRWIEAHVRPERRAPATWRLLGDLCIAAMDLNAAVCAYEHALRRDKTGRHLTLTRLGDVQRVLGDLKAAERAYRDANEFRARTYQRDDAAALQGLAEVLQARGRAEDASEVRGRLAKCGADGSRRSGEAAA